MRTKWFGDGATLARGRARPLARGRRLKDAATARRRAAWAAALALLCAALAGPGLTRAGGATLEEIVRLPSEGGAVQPYLLSRDDEHAAAAVAVLFTGGAGNVGLLGRGIPQPGANFLVRSRQRFVDHGIATAVIDLPSDTGSMSDRFRMSDRHARDVAAVVADLKVRLPDARVFLVGTSRGTVSAAYTGAALGPAVAGVVLTSSVFNAGKGGAGLAGFDFGSIQSALLLVHHVDDACPVTPYRGAVKRSSDYPLISVHGGDPPRSDACEPFSAHGYVGVEGPAVDAISHWILGEPVPREVP